MAVRERRAQHGVTMFLQRCGRGLVLLVLLFSGGCAEPPVGPPTEVAIVPHISEEVRGKLLEGAITILDTLENYDEALAVEQVFDRLNQWIHADPVGDAAASAEWKEDSLRDSLSEDYQDMCTDEKLGSSVFDPIYDIVAIRDQRWLADIAKTARGEALDDIDIATSLFRWTIRSLAIQSDPPLLATAGSSGVRWFERGEILLSGRGSAAQRSWIFLELLRQAGLQGVMLATVDRDGSYRPWLPALISGGEAYLFEPTYGIPVPSVGAPGVATVREAAANPAVLTQFDDDSRRYPVASDDMSSLVVLVVADPQSLSRRMDLLEQSLFGGSAVRLATDASALGSFAVAALPQGERETPVALWSFPFEVRRRRQAKEMAVNHALAEELQVMGVVVEEKRKGSGLSSGRRTIRPLYAGRLREFRGELEGPNGAKKAYLLARPSNAAVADLVARVPEGQREAVRKVYVQMKEDATYWLGIVTLSEGDYEIAVDYLGRMTLLASPDGRWASAARVNLAEAKIQTGDTQGAIELLREDRSPQRFGSRFRAQQVAPGSTPEAPTRQPEDETKAGPSE